MQEKILAILKKEQKALSAQEIYDLLELNGVDDLKNLLKELQVLEENLQIYRTKKDNYMLFTNSHLKLGKMIANKKGFGFVDIEGDEDVFIAPSNINGAIHGDQVVVEITSKKGMDLEGRIVRVVNRDLKQLVGEYYTKDGMGYIKLDDEKVKLLVSIKLENSLGAMDGHKVLVKIGNKIKDNNYEGEVVRILGHKNDPGVDILSIVAKYGINDTFSEKVMDEVEVLPNEVSLEEIKDRKDLRDHMIFTIDGDDTKDIDDAIELNKLENGNYLLGVHIADVSYYVKENTEIDKEAYDRGTSVYLADRVIPMLPHKLSNGICSLNPNVDRLSVSCVMEINNKGDILKAEIFPSVIKSRKQMTYKNVNSILEQNIIPEGYQEYADKLKEMHALAHILRENKMRRGYIDFDIDESKIIVNEDGKAIDVVLRNRGEGEKLIEDFMIAANEAVATYIYMMDLPFVYRVHGKPDEEKITNFIKFIGMLGYRVSTRINDITPKAMQKILEELNDKKEFHILSKLLLRSMQKAVYDPTNIGHFGIASKCYTHFTSPIRRYPDTTVHRLLRTYLFENKMGMDTIRYWEQKLPFLTEHASNKERDSVECEREVDDMKKAEYMMDHIGDRYTGIISSVLTFGFFVELPNLVEGLVRIDDLPGNSRYIYDETTFSIRSNQDKRGYRLGDEVNVIVKDANKANKTVDFIIDTKEEK